MEQKQENTKEVTVLKRSLKDRVNASLLRLTVPALLAVPAALGAADRAFAISVTPDTKTLTSKIDAAGGSFVSVAQSVAVVVMVVFIIIIAYTLFIKKSAESLADLKGKLLGLVVAVIFTFFPEEVIGMFLGLFGAKVTMVLPFFHF